jgi:hypothetical protein
MGKVLVFWSQAKISRRSVFSRCLVCCWLMADAAKGIVRSEARLSLSDG